MADRTSIEWTDATWTPIKGCTRKSAGCVNCYAEVMAARFSRPGQWGEGLARIVDTPAGKDHRWTGAIRFDEGELLKPFRWTRPRMIFVCSTSDLFHEAVTATMLDQVFAVMALLRQHTFQVLTKRPERMWRYLSAEGGGSPWLRISAHMKRIAQQLGVAVPDVGLFAMPSNIWPGVSAEDQPTADERIPYLQRCPGIVRWVSAEPMLGPLDLRRYMADAISIDDPPPIDWVVAGGESGPGARPMHPDWARSLRDQCERHDVSFLFKQWGAWKNGSDFATDAMAITSDGRAVDPTKVGLSAADRVAPIGNATMMRRVGKKRAGRLLDGIEHNGFPAATEIPFG